MVVDPLLRFTAAPEKSLRVGPKAHGKRHWQGLDRFPENLQHKRIIGPQRIAPSAESLRKRGFPRAGEPAETHHRIPGHLKRAGVQNFAAPRLERHGEYATIESVLDQLRPWRPFRRCRHVTAVALKLEHRKARKLHTISAIVVINVTTSHSLRISPYFTSGTGRTPAGAVLDNELKRCHRQLRELRLRYAKFARIGWLNTKLAAAALYYFGGVAFIGELHRLPGLLLRGRCI
jgi:hypothetical protein